ncbi:MAG: DNA topoisomerase VI subunit B [Candidatus Aenigmatarchaeota archaeon]
MTEGKRRKTAEDMAKEQKEISISEFFEKNKHLLGFDNPTKALLMCAKEAVDNALDACEEAGIVPDISIKIRQLKDENFRITVQDNGPGIVKENIGKVFGKLLYGSKFHRLKQSRGQQGIGISACVLYSQLTTGANTRVWSKTEEEKKMHYYELQLDTRKNEPTILKEDTIEPLFEHGVRVEIDVSGRYRRWVEDYLKQTSIANPFAKISYNAPDGTRTTFPRSVNELPKPPKEMKPHPYGIEFGILQRMLGITASRSLSAFLVNEFSSTGSHSSKEMCKIAKLDPNLKPTQLDRDQTEKLLNAMQKVRVQRPPTDCLSPVGKEELEKSLKKEYPTAEFVIVRSRDPEVYRGFPFQIEIGIVYGGELKEDTIELIRVANRVPLLYQAGACATMEAAKETDWKRYGLSQQTNSLPTGKMVLIVHMASVWVPFVSESKEAIAPYPDIVKEMKLAIQDAGRELSRYLSGKRRVGEQKRRILIFERYSTEVAEALSEITGKSKNDLEKKLKSFIGERVKVNEAGEVEGIEGTKETSESKPTPKKEKQSTLKGTTKNTED